MGNLTSIHKKMHVLMKMMQKLMPNISLHTAKQHTAREDDQ